MSRPRIVMRKIREVLRLTFAEGLSRRRVSQAVGLPTATIVDYIRRAAAAGLTAWPLPVEIDDRELEQRLFVSAVPVVVMRPLPDWAAVKKELGKRG